MSRPSLAEAAGLLAKGAAVYIGRKQAITEFKDSREDVIKSFWAAGLLFPVYLWLTYGLGSNPYDGANEITRFLAHSVNYVFAWVYWPLIMASVSQTMGYPENWARYVIVVNWTFSVPFLFVVTVFTVLGPGAQTALVGLSAGIQLWSFLIHGWLLQKFFKTSLALTIALLAAEFLIYLLAQEFENRIILRSML